MRPAADIAVPPPFRLRAVVLSHGWFQTPPFAWDPAAGVLTRVEPLPSGPVTVRVREAPGGVAVTTGRDLAPGERQEVLARMRRVLQAGRDVAGLADAAAAVDPALGADLAALGAGRMLAGASLWEDALKSVAATNIRWSGAVTCITRIAALDPHGGWPAPARVLAAGEDVLRRDARVGYRAPYMLAMARRAEEGDLQRMEAEAPGLDAADLGRRLRGLPGIGPSTSAFLALLLGRGEVASVDSAVIRQAAAGWFAGRTPTAAEVLDRAAPAGPHIGLVLAWYTMRGWHREVGLALA